MACLGGQSGRLFQELREKRGLCYQVQGFQFEGMYPGATGFYLGCANEKVSESLQHLEQLIQEVCANPLTDVEVDRARKRLLGQKLLAAQSIQTQAAAFCINQTVGLPFDQHLHLEKRLNRLCATDLQIVAQEIFQPNKQVVAVVGHLPNDGPQANVDGAALLGILPKSV
jgi:zinc protease